jgi:putative radical SAM enzyme (TIGR03279 family)
MRESLYFKDDDSRLSFLFGNYVTLTNLTQHEIDRIIKLHISPINVSVHTTNPDLRVKMMNNRFAGKVLEVLPKFAEAGIKINCQIVACPGINDGKELERTLTDLEHLYPAVECIAVVPVGLTAYREGLYPLVEYTKETATETLDLIESYGEKFKEKYGCRIVYASDEFFLKAEREIPEADYYEDFDQLDNGVGLLSLLRDELLYALEDDITATDEKTVTIACGTGVAEFMQTLMNNITERFNNVKINVVGIKNNFFGGGVDVSGLVTGQDLLAQLKDKDLGDKLLIPQVMLRSDGDLFLDDISIDEVRETLKVPVITVANNGETLLNEILS